MIKSAPKGPLTLLRAYLIIEVAGDGGLAEAGTETAEVPGLQMLRSLACRC
jgi:hypothetical protein